MAIATTWTHWKNKKVGPFVKNYLNKNISNISSEVKECKGIDATGDPNQSLHNWRLGIIHLSSNIDLH